MPSFFLTENAVHDGSNLGKNNEDVQLPTVSPIRFDHSTEKKYVTQKIVQLQQPNITVINSRHIESEPKLQTKIIKDDEGNMMKVTDLHKSVTTSVDYTDDFDLEINPDDISRHSSASESIGGTGYVEMKVEKINVQPSSCKQNISNTADAEVIEEVTSTYKPIEYDNQEAKASNTLVAGQTVPMIPFYTGTDGEKKNVRNIKKLLEDTMSTHL